jgi:hypothetical protein
MEKAELKTMEEEENKRCIALMNKVIRVQDQLYDTMEKEMYVKRKTIDGTWITEKKKVKDVCHLILNKRELKMARRAVASVERRRK